MSLLLTAYQSLTFAGKPLLKAVLARRVRGQKEDPERIGERMGQAARPRPQGPLVWIHGASVGESQSTLILIDAISRQYPSVSFLITTGTITSAQLMSKRLPDNAIHQFIPVDHPQWVQSFLDHWKPDAALWMESEIWPNMVMETGKRNIPLVLINARVSEKSFARWKTAKGMIGKILDQFSLILTQTGKDEKNFRALGAASVETTGNLKYSSAPLPFDAAKLNTLKTATEGRAIWVYASTHDGEETLACRVHEKLKTHIPGLLTILVPRHIQRRDAIAQICRDAGLPYSLRGEHQQLPSAADNIYIADTMGELGLFYSLAPVAMIGRSFSNDGGGGHNPVEAAQLGCAVLTGPNVQYQQQMFDDMFHDGAAIRAKNEDALYTILCNLFEDPSRLEDLQKKSGDFAREKSHVIDHVMTHLAPHLKVLERANAG